jgi:hypothetical protein
MALTEISLAEVLEKTSGTSYFASFVQLVGKTNELVLYKGITREDEPLIEELQEKLNHSISSNYLEFLTITNGGKIAGMNLYSLAQKDYVNSLYYRNFETELRKKLKLPSTVLLIGEYEGGVICFEVDENDDGTFVLMDIYNREKLEFAFFEDLITFRFYFRLLEGGKKKIEEKEKLKKAAKKLHEQIVKEDKERKLVSEKARKRSAKGGMKKDKNKKR